MKNVCCLCLVLLTQGLIVNCGKRAAEPPKPKTFWIDKSCQDGNNKEVVQLAIQDFQEWARKAADRLRRPTSKEDILQRTYFLHLFAHFGDHHYDQKLARVIGVLGGDDNEAGIANLVEERNDELRHETNYRIYCDDDNMDDGKRRREDRDRKPRWRQKLERGEAHGERRYPESYVLNRDRQTYMELKTASRSLAWFREYEDPGE
ncbi:MAG: hypothetical protein Q9160_007969 [Pyrenula sp. 1 TL-2023]